MKALGVFIRQSLISFIQVGAILPSSSQLAKRITKNINGKLVLELGPGTGIFTEEILKKLPSDGKVICIENNKIFAAHLRKKITDKRFKLVIDDALNLKKILREQGVDRVDCVVSGLPIGNFSKQDKRKVLQDIHDSLEGGGQYLQFEYFLAGIKAVKEFFPKIVISFEFFNVPPAFVMECKK